MINLLEWILSDFWHFVGTIILILVTGHSLSLVSNGFSSKYVPLTYNITTDKDKIKIENPNDKD